MGDAFRYNLINMTLDCIVSITSWRGRIHSEIVLANLRRLLAQNTNFSYKVTLVLAEEEFPRKEAELPTALVELAQTEPNFEIVWVRDNTRALKKLGSWPKYPNVPIITTDDDIAVKDTFVEEFMRCHLEHPKDIITAHLWTHPTGIEMSGWGRLFPVGSLAWLPDVCFMRFFRGLEDDVYSGLRATLAGTKHRKLGSWPFEGEVPMPGALRNEYLNTDVAAMLRDFAKGWEKCV